MLQGYQLTLQLDGSSKDGTKIIVYGLAPGIEWQEIKDHFGKVGVVAYAGVTTPGVIPSGMLAVAGNGLKCGEVRFDAIADLEGAVQDLDGSLLAGMPIQVQVDHTSKDKTKMTVFGLSPQVEWQELKDHFGKVGKVAFAQVFSGPQPNMMASFMSRMGGDFPPSPARPGMANTKLIAGGLPFGFGLTPMGLAPMGMNGQVAEVRFKDQANAHRAMAMLDGCEMGGRAIGVNLDPLSPDGTKVLVSNLPHTVKWQMLKDIFGRVGPVAFCAMRP